MASKKRRAERGPSGADTPGSPTSGSDPRPRSLALAVALAGVHALWALFQWTELVDARRGGEGYCAFGAGDQCASVWDSAFASGVQSWTGLPVAGWGLAWSAVAFLFPLLVLVRRAGGREPGAAWSAALWTSLAGVGGVAVFATASLAAGALCSTCAVTYVLVLAYAITCLTAAPHVRAALAVRGVGLAAAATAAAFLLLLPPGLRTPAASGAGVEAALEAVERVGEGAAPAEPSATAEEPSRPPAEVTLAADEGEGTAPEPPARSGEERPGEGAEAALGPDESGGEATAPAEPARADEGSPREPVAAAEPEEGGREGAAPAEPSATDEERLRELLTGLPSEAKQILADELALYEQGDPPPVRPPRFLIGPADAPLRLTDFTDTLCSHCASLHEVLARLRAVAPGAFAIEPRQFPLDGSCNPALPRASSQPVRCLAAKALICAEGRPGFFEYAGALFERQRTLSEKDVYALAEPYIARAPLEECVGSKQTQEKLNEDVEWAVQHDIRGTPLVLVNGRKGSGFPPFVYAIVLARGDVHHPLFAQLLPEPSPAAAAH